VSFLVGERRDALLILTIVLASAALGFWQERGATRAVERLLASVTTHATVVRGGVPCDVPREHVVVGDVLRLTAGDAVPGDCRILDAKDLFVVESALTGESYPVEKLAGIVAADAPLCSRTNAVFLGTHVASGTATAVVARTGRATEFGAIADRLRLRPPETEFERGVRRFGYLLAEVTFVLVVAIFAINVAFARPVLDSLLFSLALAVGLTPQLLPAIISVNLAHGARRMAARQVIVKRLAAIENLGSMDVLCSDKTGTLTEGVVRVHSAVGFDGQERPRVLDLAYVNAALETGFANPIDVAIRALDRVDLAAWVKRDEVPYDFARKRLSIAVAHGGRTLLVTKGALAQVLEVCATAEGRDGSTVPLASVRDAVDARFHALSEQGLRVLGVAVRELDGAARAGRDAERGMCFVGMLALFDPPKPEIAATVATLRDLGVDLKIVSGDNRLVATALGRALGLPAPRVLTGADLRRTSDDALVRRVGDVDLFAEIEPNQKERIVLALKKAGHVVGYLGDGINDASAIHAADVGLSVEGAVDVAREAADIVLLDRALAVIIDGVREGRATFANTLKYVFMATSANFGNMFSMAGASLFLPFLPLLPKQILLMNLLTDLPEMTIATDRIDRGWIERPHRWNVEFIRAFMVTFGAVSSIFDFMTFAVLRWVLGAGIDEFRTGWFVESVVSATLIVLVVRTRGALWRSRPGNALVVATIGVVLATVLLPLTPLAGAMSFTPVPRAFLLALVGIVGSYVATAEAAKRLFYRRRT
jgi:Mg2+-importing ATPase